MDDVPVVHLRGVSFTRNGNRILSGISLRIRRGEHWALIGPNGSGKTSLVSIICCYHHPSGGSACVLGREFGKTDMRELRRHIGECSSEIGAMVHAWEPLKDIVLSGRFASIGLYEAHSEKDEERAGMLLSLFGLSGLAKRRFSTLSDGERQKTLLARALMPEPDLLVLDEPCAGLDIRAREELLDAVETLCAKDAGPTLIYVTHHIEELVPSITHALALREGKAVASGRRSDVLTASVLSRTFGVSIDLEQRYGRLLPVVNKP
ncbi:MAG TPA: ATP-binding cassette domain-containing protein [Candidatus Methanoperedenaceae archaeon]|nr:ATP-binding cassette domain-containing protein [Candidatus Methanoperedenaceae archaeon]